MAIWNHRLAWLLVAQRSPLFQSTASRRLHLIVKYITVDISIYTPDLT